LAGAAAGAAEAASAGLAAAGAAPPAAAPPAAPAAAACTAGPNPAGGAHSGRMHWAFGSLTEMVIWHWKNSWARSAYLKILVSLCKFKVAQAADLLEHVSLLAGHQVGGVFEVVEQELVNRATFGRQQINLITVSIIDETAETSSILYLHRVNGPVSFTSYLWTTMQKVSTEKEQNF
jgi:hypothetical protein